MERECEFQYVWEYFFFLLWLFLSMEDCFFCVFFVDIFESNIDYNEIQFFNWVIVRVNLIFL